MRRVVLSDYENNRTFVFYTNNTVLSAENIALAYKYRWRVELFFRWIKQHLHVKEFYGTNENAVKIQLYCAIIAYCLVAVVERKMKLDMEMYELLRILSISLLDKTPLKDLLMNNSSTENLQTVRELSLKFI
jgi:transposase